MSKREYLSRYHLIIKKLRKSPATFEEILDFLKRESELQEYDFEISKRTFQRDVEDIKATLGIYIEYDFSKKVYFIEEDIDENNPIKNRMLEAFDLFNAFNVTESINEYVLFEKRKSKGVEHFYGLLYAIKNRYVIELTHQKFWDDDANKRMLKPIALKEFKGRWYLLGKEEQSDAIKTFGLDRISDFNVTKRTFEKINYSEIGNMFNDCFGIVNPQDQQPEKVVLRFTYEQGCYIKTYPLHDSQKIISENEGSNVTMVELNLKITHDFIMELLSFGEDLTVVKPIRLSKRIKSGLEKTLKLYEN